jgi:zinc protease
MRGFFLPFRFRGCVRRKKERRVMLRSFVLFLAFAVVHAAAPVMVQAAASKSSSASFKDLEKTKAIQVLTSDLSTQMYTLPNGLQVFLTENPKAPNVVVGHWVKAGSLHETPGTTGIAHLFEHMMFRPLKKGAPSFFDITTKLGAEFNANTRFEATYFYTAVTPDKLPELLKYESDRFTKLTVTKELLDVERKAVWSEYSTKFDANPIIDLWFQIYRQAYVGHPFGWMIIGQREDLEKITAEDCNKFYKKYYAPNNTGLFITGNFKSEKVLKEIVRLYSPWKKGEVSQLPPPYTQKTTQIVGEGALPSEGRFVLFGLRTPYFNKDNIRTQALVDYIFFDGTHGLLKKRLVDEKKIAASASSFNFDNDNGMLKAGITVLPSTKLSDLQKEALQAGEDFKAMSEADYQTYKNNFYIAAGEGLQRNAALSEFLAVSWGKYADINLTKEIREAPLAVTKAQLQEFLNQYYKADNFIFLTHKGQGK